MPKDTEHSAVRRFTPALPAAVLIAVLLVATGFGACTAPLPGILCALLVLVVCGVLAVLRPVILTHVGTWPSVCRGVFGIVMVIAASMLSVLALELPWNVGFAQMAPSWLALNFALVFLAVAGLWLLGQRHSGLARVAVVACMVFGLAEYFVYLFKNTVIAPSDLLALGTAAAVSTQYAYVINGAALYGILCTCGAWLLLSFAVPCAPAGGGRSLRRIVVNVICALACFTGLCALVSVPDFRDDFGIAIDAWAPYHSYCEYGFLPSMISVAQNMVVDEPAGYTEEDADELLVAYSAAYEESLDDETREALQAQFEEVQPTVIAVMNETFSDLADVYDGLGAGYEGPKYFENGLDDALVKGQLTVSAMGGGTCNVEFEFLTGFSLTMCGAGVYPYEFYDFDDCDSLVSQFSELGYSTSAIHPNLASNWSRDEVYAELGFDEFYSIEDFDGAETYRDLVTDAATYDKILELLEADDAPQFIFDVTMQNHGGYETGLIPEKDQLSYSSSAFDDSEVNSALNEYLACIEKSDDALEDFIAALSELDCPVVLLFFGDHQPSFVSTYNDGQYPDEEEGIEHVNRIYRSAYAMWANYDVEGNAQTSEEGSTSSCYLGAELLEAIGAPLSDYQEAMLALSEEIPLVNAYGYQTADGTWRSPTYEDEHADAYDDFVALEYRRLSAQLLD